MSMTLAIVNCEHTNLLNECSYGHTYIYIYIYIYTIYRMCVYIYIYMIYDIYIYIYVYVCHALRGPGAPGARSLVSRACRAAAPTALVAPPVTCSYYYYIYIYIYICIIAIHIHIHIQIYHTYTYTYSSSNLSIRAFRAFPLIEIRQMVPCRAIRGNSPSPPLVLEPQETKIKERSGSCSELRK